MEILTILAENKDFGIAILVIIIVIVFLKYLKEEGKLSREHSKDESFLSRETHERISQDSASALKEVTAVIKTLHDSNVMSHNKIQNGNEKILEKVSDTHKKIDDIHYQVIKK